VSNQGQLSCMNLPGSILWLIFVYDILHALTAPWLNSSQRNYHCVQLNKLIEQGVKYKTP